MSWFSFKLKNIENYPFCKLEQSRLGYVVCSLCRFSHNSFEKGTAKSKIHKNKTYTLFTCADCKGTYCYNITDNTCLLTESIDEDIEKRIESFKDTEKTLAAVKKAEHDAERLTILENKVEELYLLLDKYKISRY